MSASVFGVLAPQPFEEASSPPVSPSGEENPYDAALKRYRSGSISSTHNAHPIQRNGSHSSTKSSIPPTTPTGSRGFLGRRKSSTKSAKSPLERKKSMKADEEAVEEEDIPEADEHLYGGEDVNRVQTSSPAPPPAWKRRTSALQKEQERKRRESMSAASGGPVEGLPNGEGNAGVLMSMNAVVESGLAGLPHSHSGNGSRPPDSSRMLSTATLNTTASGTSNSGSTTSDHGGPMVITPMTSLGDRDAFGHAAQYDGDDFAPPNAAFAKSSGEGGESPRSSTSSLRSYDSPYARGNPASNPNPSQSHVESGSLTPPRRLSSYGGQGSKSVTSPLSMTTQEHEHHRHMRAANAVGGPEGMIPDMSNPTRASGERPLDTVFRMSMISDSAITDSRGSRMSRDGSRSGNGSRRTTSALGGSRGRKVGPMSSDAALIGIPIDDSIWPSIPTLNIDTKGKDRSLKSRSVISLTSLHHSPTQTKSTPSSPQNKGKSFSRSSSRSNSNAALSPPLPEFAQLTPSARAQYIMGIQRDYSMRLGGMREGGYAVAASMNQPGFGGSNRNSVSDFGNLGAGGDWSQFFDQGPGAQYGSPPWQTHSTSTSTTSLSLQNSDYPSSNNPPVSYPSSIPTDTSPSMTPQLHKSPSPLSHHVPTEDESSPELDMHDNGLEMKRRRVSSTPILPSAQTTPPPGFPATSLGDNDRTPTKAKSKKDLAKEAKEAKRLAEKQAKEKAIAAAVKRAEDEKARQRQMKLDKEKAKEQAKADKLAAKLGKKTDKAKLSLPATPLKGKTKPLADTPSTVPTTPLFRPKNVPLIQTDSQPGSRRQSGLGERPVTAAPPATLPPGAAPSFAPGSNVNGTPVPSMQPTPKPAPTPQVKPVAQRSAAANPEPTRPGPLKPKRSFWGTMRRKFSSDPAAAVPPLPVARDKPTPPTPPTEPSTGPATPKPLYPTDYPVSLAGSRPETPNGYVNGHGLPVPERLDQATPVSSNGASSHGQATSEDAYSQLRPQTPPAGETGDARQRRVSDPPANIRRASATSTKELQRSAAALRSPSATSKRSRPYSIASPTDLRRRSVDTIVLAQDIVLPISRTTTRTSVPPLLSPGA